MPEQIDGWKKKALEFFFTTGKKPDEAPGSFLEKRKRDLDEAAGDVPVEPTGFKKMKTTEEDPTLIKNKK